MPVLKPLAGSGDAPQQHSQPSRKGKRAWRKNVDVSEVERGLDRLNEEIIRGCGPPEAQITNAGILC